MLMHGAAGACLLWILPGWPGALLGAAVLALGGVAALDRALLRGAGAPSALELSSTGEAALVMADGRRAVVSALPGMGVTKYWVALRLSGLPARRALLIPADMLDGRQGRLLRLWALWGRLPAVASRQLGA